MSARIQVTLVKSGQKQKLTIAAGRTVAQLLERAATKGVEVANCQVRENHESGRVVSMQRELTENCTFYLTANVKGGNR